MMSSARSAAVTAAAATPTVSLDDRAISAMACCISSLDDTTISGTGVADPHG